MVPPRSSTAVRTTSRPDAAAGGLGDLVAGGEAGREQHLQQRRAGERRAVGQQRRARRRPRAARSSSTPRPSSDTSMTTVEPAARATTVTVAAAGLPAATRSRGRLAAVVDGVGDQVAQRVGDAVEHPGVELDVLPGEHERGRPCAARVPRRRRQLADQLREAGDDPAHRHHRQAHRAVADIGEPALRRPRRGPSSSRLAAPSWSPSDDQRVHGVGHARGVCSPLRWPCEAASRSARAQRRWSAASAASSRPCGRDPADVELGLADDVEQVVHPAGGHADRVAAAARRLAGRRRRRPPRRPAAGTVDRVVAGDGAVEGGHDAAELVGPHRALGAGQRAARCSRRPRAAGRPGPCGRASRPSAGRRAGPRRGGRRRRRRRDRASGPSP